MITSLLPGYIPLQHERFITCHPLVKGTFVASAFSVPGQLPSFAPISVVYRGELLPECCSVSPHGAWRRSRESAAVVVAFSLHERDMVLG